MAISPAIPRPDAAKAASSRRARTRSGNATSPATTTAGASQASGFAKAAQRSAAKRPAGDRRHDPQDRHRGPADERGAPGALGQRPARLQRQPRPAVGDDHRHREQADHQREGRQQPDEPARVVAGRVDRQAAQDVPDGDPEEEGRHGRPDEERDVPRPPPTGPVDLVAELQGHRPEDQRGEQEHERQVEAREDGRVDDRERREQRPAGGQEPDLVAVPDRPDRAQDHPPLVVAPGDEEVEDARAKVEAVEHRVAEQEDPDEDEPDVTEGGHVSGPPRVGSPPAWRRAPAMARSGRVAGPGPRGSPAGRGTATAPPAGRRSR